MVALSPHRSTALARDHEPSLAQARLRWTYLGAFAAWMVTRCLVLVHQGGWAWMNAFVVWAAEHFLAGDFNEVQRPPLPALLAMPLLAMGATMQQIVAVLYLLASALQFAAFALVVLLTLPHRRREQTLALLVFLVLPLNHSIHHYRDTPVIFGSIAVLLLAAHWLWVERDPDRRVWRPISIVWALAAGTVGAWSRMEVLAFVGALCILALLVERRRALRPVALYVAGAALGVATLLGLGGALGADTRMNAEYQVHTFLDSTPESWLSPACRANPTENCRDADGSVYFGPVDREAGVLGIVVSHPWLTLVKTVQSAGINLWVLFGDNLSTFPGAAVLLGALLLLFEPCRAALRRLPFAAWPPLGAAFAMSVVPPLSWAPPHPQYHLNMLLPVAIVLAATLGALFDLGRGRLAVGLACAASAALSAFRYTRYPGT
jgi:uncharacterized membrane protein